MYGLAIWRAVWAILKGGSDNIVGLFGKNCRGVGAHNIVQVALGPSTIVQTAIQIARPPNQN